MWDPTLRIDLFVTLAPISELSEREAELRERGEVLNIHDYVALRREMGAVRPCFDFGGVRFRYQPFQRGI